MCPVEASEAAQASTPAVFDGRKALARLEALGVIGKWRAHNDGRERSYHVQTDLGVWGSWSEQEVRRFTDGALVALRAVRDGRSVWHPYHHGFIDARDIPDTRHYWELENLVCLALETEPKRTLEEIQHLAEIFQAAGK